MFIFNYILVAILSVFSVLSFASVEGLYLESLKKSKQVEIFNLTRDKTLSDLKVIESSLYPSVDIVSDNDYSKQATSSSVGRSEFDSELYLSMNQKLFQGGSRICTSRL